MGLLSLEFRKNSFKGVIIGNILVWIFMSWVMFLIVDEIELTSLSIKVIIDNLIQMYILILPSILMCKLFIKDIKNGWFKLMRGYPFKINDVLIVKWIVVIGGTFLFSFLIYNMLYISVVLVCTIMGKGLLDFSFVAYMKLQVYIVAVCMLNICIGLISSFAGMYMKSEKWLIGTGLFVTFGVNSYKENMMKGNFDFILIALAVIGIISMVASIRCLYERYR